MATAAFPARPAPAPAAAAAPVRTPDPYAHKWVIAIGVVLAAVMELIDTSIINVALTQMSANLGATLDEIAWVSTGYIVAAVIVLPMTGWLSTFFGRTRYLVGSIILFTIASWLCGQSTSLAELVVWRVVQGIGGGALIATSQAILFESFPKSQQTLAAALFGIGMMVGPAIGPTLGGIIVDRYTWPWIFYINLPVGVLAAFMVWTYTSDPPTQQRPTKLDLPGIALIMLGIGSLQFVLERGEHYDWFDSHLITWLSVISAVSLALLVWWELHTDQPVLNLRVLKDRSLAAGSAFAVILGIALYGSIFALPIFIQQLLGYDAETAGWILFPGALGSAVAMIFIARVGPKLPDMRWLIAIGAVMVSGSMYFHGQFTLDSGQHEMLWPVVFRGMGTGFMFVPLTTSAIANLKGRTLADGSAIFNLTRQLGGSIGIAVLATKLTQRAQQHRAALVEPAGVYDATTLDRLQMMARGFTSRGIDPMTAARKALAALDYTVQRQATLLAFSDVFHLVMILMLCALPLIAVLRRPARGGPLHMGE